MTLMRSPKLTCRTILLVADAEPKKRHKNQITFSFQTRHTDEHDRMKCENLRTLESRAHTITIHPSERVLKPVLLCCTLGVCVCTFAVLPFKLYEYTRHVCYKI